MATGNIPTWAEVDVENGVFYPSRDDTPLGETQDHLHAIIDLIQALADRYAADPRAFVTGDQFLYYVEGDPKKVVCPDVMVVLDVDPARNRRTYKTWRNDGRTPELVVEVTSASTRRADVGSKLRLYRDVLRVPEYFLFDPLDEYLDPPLQGYRLAGGAYTPIAPVAGRLPSAVLGLHLVAAGETVRLFDPAVGAILPTRLEALDASRRENHEKAEEIARKDRALREADAERDRLLAEIARLKSGGAG